MKHILENVIFPGSDPICWRLFTYTDLKLMASPPEWNRFSATAWKATAVRLYVRSPSFTRVARDQFNIETATSSDFTRALFTQRNLGL